MERHSQHELELVKEAFRKQRDEHGRLIESGFVETELVDGHGDGRNLTVCLGVCVSKKKAWSPWP